MHASLEDWQEELVVELRTTMLLPLNDLLGVARKVMKPTLTRSALKRCLVRHGAGNLRALRASLKDKAAVADKHFKDDAGGLFHVDVKYLPRMSDEIHCILTDNGKEFSDRFPRSGEGTPTGQHSFDQKCRELNIEHRLIPAQALGDESNRTIPPKRDN